MRVIEEQVRFAIMSHYELCEEAATVENQDAFDAHLNMQQLNNVRAKALAPH